VRSAASELQSLSFSLSLSLSVRTNAICERGLLESQCEISGHRLLALRLAGRSHRCTYYRQDNASLSPLSCSVAFFACVRRAGQEREREREREKGPE